MRSRATVSVITALLGVSLLTGDQLQAQASDSAAELVGLWKAKRRFGPDARGSLIVERTGSGYTADMMGFIMPVSVTDNELSFELPNREGAFRGQPQAGGTIRGVWFTAPLGTLGSATPVTLLPKGPNRWAGQVTPADDTQTFYLLVSRQADGSLSALLRNIERDYGALLGIRGLVRTGTMISLVGRRGAMTRDTVLVNGSYDTAQKVITLNFPYRGGSYDFRRDDDDQSDFYRAASARRVTSIACPLLWMTVGRRRVWTTSASIARRSSVPFSTLPTCRWTRSMRRRCTPC
jgi:hypothetical protein